MIKIKKIEKNEADAVIDLFNKYRLFYRQPSDIELAKHFISERLNNNDSVVFVAFDENNDKNIPVGFAQLFPKYSSVRAVKNWILNDLYIEAGYRKQGIGTNLIQTAIDFAKSTNSQFVQLSTQASNYTAQRLYEVMGFTIAEPETDFYTYRISV